MSIEGTYGLSSEVLQCSAAFAGPPGAIEQWPAQRRAIPHLLQLVRCHDVALPHKFNSKFAPVFMGGFGNFVQLQEGRLQVKVPIKT